MTTWITQLKEKPRATRQKIAFLVSFFLTAIVALGWLVYLSPFVQPIEKEASTGIFTTLSDSLNNIFGEESVQNSEVSVEGASPGGSEDQQTNATSTFGSEQATSSDSQGENGTSTQTRSTSSVEVEEE